MAERARTRIHSETPTRPEGRAMTGLDLRVVSVSPALRTGAVGLTCTCTCNKPTVYMDVVQFRVDCGYQ